MALDNKDRIDIEDDHVSISEDGQSIKGNVFDNDIRERQVNQQGGTNEYAHVNLQLTVENGSLSTDANTNTPDDNGLIQGKYGTLKLNDDGSYVYTLTVDKNSLGAGVDLHDEVFYFNTEWNNTTTNQAGSDQNTQEKITIDIHGENDKVLIKDVTVSAFEGGDHAGDVPIYNGQFVLEDLPGQPAGTKDLDAGDTHTFQMVANSLKVDSSSVDKALLTGVDVTVNANGSYVVTGDFDALSVGDTATVTFQYQAVEQSAAGFNSLSDPKTVTLTVVGQNDKVEIRPDNITTYDQLIDGDIYKSILANDGHYDPAGGNVMAKDIDVNDKLTIASTGFHDLQFYQEGGSISVDNAARVLQYTPGSGGAIAKDHFSFYYQATDGHTDPIGSTTAEFDMVNKDGDAIDWYQFGDAGDDTLNGVKGKNNVLSGMAGNDYIEGKEKGDILYGGAGQDIMQGGWGNDIYKGGTGNDGITDTRGNDLYVFSKGDGRDTIDDMSLEIYTDAMGHETINMNHFVQLEEYGSVDFSDTVRFDKSVDIKDIAIFQENGQYGSLLLKYSDNADDKVSVGWQQERHYGIERIEAYDANGNLVSIDTRSDELYDGFIGGPKPKQFDKDGDGTKDLSYDELIQYIASYDLDGDATNGIQAAQNVQDVQNNEHLMAVIATGWA